MQGRIEEELEAMWQDILGTVNFNRGTDFFAIGGNSLRAIQLVTRIKKNFKIKLLVKEIFSLHTITEQAAVIANRTASEADVIPQIGKTAVYELSHSQKRIWIAERGQSRQNGVYNICESFVIPTRMDLGTIIGAFEKVIQRHESLRTTFLAVEGQPRQRVSDSIKFTPVFHDLRKDPDGWSTAGEKIMACGEEAFDLEGGPLFRVQIYRLAEERWVVQLVMHHIISDGWSVQVLIRDFLEYYAALDKSREPAIMPLPLQYRDFAAWHNQWVKGDKRRAAEQYWKDQLGGDLPLLDLPTDRIRPVRKSGEGSLMSFTIPSPIIDPILMGSRAQRAATVLALSIAVLHKYTGQNDMIIGMPFSGRCLPDLEDQVGCYVNMLPLRIRFSSDEPFAGLIAICEREVIHAFEQEAMPLDLIIDGLEKPVMPGSTALFNVSVSYNNFDITLKQTHDFPVEKVEKLPFSQRSSKFDLTFHYYDAPGGFSVSLEYNTDIFFDERISLLYKHLERLMIEIDRAPDRPLKEIGIWDHIEMTIMETVKRYVPVPDGILLNDDFMKIEDDPEIPVRLAASLNQKLAVQLSAGDICLFPTCYALAGCIRNNINNPLW